MSLPKNLCWDITIEREPALGAPCVSPANEGLETFECAAKMDGAPSGTSAHSFGWFLSCHPNFHCWFDLLTSAPTKLQLQRSPQRKTDIPARGLECPSE